MNKSILSFEKERILVSCKEGVEQNVPQPILATCFRIETIPYCDGEYYANPLTASQVFDFNDGMYAYIREYIKTQWSTYWYESNQTDPYYNPKPDGWVYLESVDTEIDTVFNKVEGGYTSASLYTLSARIVFYNDNNFPSTSPSGV